MSILRVGVLRGGPEQFYNESVFWGGKILANLYEHLGGRVQVFDIWVDKSGVWHFRGVPIVPADLASRVDVVWDTTHGNPSSVLASISMPKIGPSLFVNSLLRSRSMLKEHLASKQINIPRSIIIPPYQPDFDSPDQSNETDAFESFVNKKAKEIWQKFSPPWVLSVSSGNPNYARRVVKVFPELVNVLFEFLRAGEGVLVEELIFGKDATVHGVAGFRGNRWYQLPAGSIRNQMFSLVDLESQEKALLKEFAQKVLEHLGHDGYAKLDFVLARGKVYLKSISFYPDLADHSPLHAALDAFGIERREVLEHMLKRATVL